MNKQTFIRLIVTHPYKALMACLMVLGVAALGLPKATINGDFEIFFEDDNPDLLAYHQQKDEFTADDNIMFVISPASGDVFNAETMVMVEALTEVAWTLPASIRVDSLTNYQHTFADGDDLQVINLIEDAEQLSAADFELAREISTSEPMLYKRLVRDGDVTGVNVMFQLDGHDNNVIIPEIVAEARRIAAEFREQYPDIRIDLVGMLMNNTAFRESSLHDMANLVPIAFLLAVICIFIYMWLGSRHALTTITGTFSLLTVIVFSIVTAMGIAFWIGYPITSPLANAPTMILTLAIADSVHILVGYFQSRRDGKNKQDAMAYSLDLNYQPVLLTTVTTMVGFLSLNFSDSPPFQDLGNVVAIGVGFAWLYSVVLLPALMLILPSSVAQVKTRQGSLGWPDKLATFVERHYRRLLVVSLISIAGISVFITQNELNDVWAEYFDKSTVQRQSSDYASQNLVSSNSISFTLRAPEGETITNPEYLQHVENFSNWLKTQDGVYHVYSFADVIKRINKNMHGDDPAMHKLPDSNELAAQYLLMYEFSLPFGLDVNNQVNFDKSATKLRASLSSSSTGLVLDVQARAQQWLRDNAPEYFYDSGASGDVMFAQIGQSNVRSMLFGTILALIGISGLIAFMLRSVRYGVISLLPNLAPAAIGFGFWGMFKGEIGLSLSTVVGMTLGIVVDYSVHFMSKYLRAKRENNLSVAEAIHFSFNTVGVALVVTTVILCANFMVLAMSTFRLNSDMGIMTALMIFMALIVDFFLLAPLLLWLDSRKQKQEVGKPEQTPVSQEALSASGLSPQSAS